MEVRRVSADKAILEREAVKLELERILASADFDASPRSRAFVRFIVEETLAGRQEQLTQTAIATRVFGRREDFDPTVDPIVRIQAGRLRRSLERYYLMSGAEDPVRIELPRGTYVPVARGAAEGPQRPGEGGRGQGGAVADGWPSVVVRMFECDGWPELEPSLSRLNGRLCVEIGHYGDVRVVRRGELDQLGSPGDPGDFELLGRVSCDDGAARVTAPAGLAECEPGLGGGLPRPRERAERLLRRDRTRDRSARRLRARDRRQAALERAARPADRRAAAVRRDPALLPVLLQPQRCSTIILVPRQALERLAGRPQWRGGQRPPSPSAKHPRNRPWRRLRSTRRSPRYKTPCTSTRPASGRAPCSRARLLIKGELGAGRVEAEKAHDIYASHSSTSNGSAGCSRCWAMGAWHGPDPALDRAQSRPTSR